MIRDIVKNGWNSWKNHKVSGVPFFISGVVSGSIFLGAVILLVYLVSPELFELALSGDLTDEYLSKLADRYLENLDLVATVALAAIILFTVSDTFFRAWGIKVCSDSLSCRVNLSEGVRHAKRRFLPYLTFSLLVLGVNLAGLLPLYYIFKGLDWMSGASIVATAILFIVYGFVWLGLILIVAFLVTFVPYAIVLDGEGVIGGIRKGFRVLSKSLVETMIFWLIVGLTGIAAGVPFYPFKFLGAAGEILRFTLTTVVSWLVVMPIATMWWIDLYRRKVSQL